jgi:hypothetical protein
MRRHGAPAIIHPTDTNPFSAPASPESDVPASEVTTRSAGRAVAYRWYIVSSLFTATIWSFGQNYVFPFKGGHGFEQGWTGFWIFLLFLFVVSVVNSLGFVMAMMIAPPITSGTMWRYNVVCASLGTMNLVTFGLFIFYFTRSTSEIVLWGGSTVGQSFVIGIGILFCSLLSGFVRSDHLNDEQL